MTNEYSNRLRTKLSVQQPSGIWTNGFAYDGAKRLTNVSFHGGNIGYTFLNSASHLAKAVKLPNTAFITNTYDLMARLTGTYLKSNNGVTLNAAEYGYNAGNQRRRSAGGLHLRQLTWANSVTNSEDPRAGFFTLIHSLLMTRGQRKKKSDAGVHMRTSDTRQARHA